MKRGKEYEEIPTEVWSKKVSGKAENFVIDKVALTEGP